MAKGFKHGTGGGTALNFKVVGSTTEPSSPKENTIWVNTEKEITGWSFGATEPASPAEGMVWFTLALESPVAFNAAKKNTVMLYPVSASQYVGGAWASRDAYAYINNQWVQFSSVILDLYLYDNGTANAEFTLSNATLNDSYILLSMPKSGSASATTKETYALDKYTKCEVDYSNFECSSSTAHPTLYLTVKNEAGENVASNSVSNSKGHSGTLSLSLALTGQHSITVSASNASGNYTARVSVTGIRLLM